MSLLITIVAFLMIVTDGASPHKRFHKLDESFLMPQNIREAFQNITLTTKDRSQDMIGAWSESGNASLAIPAHPVQVQCCPWTYVIVYNPNRIPETILEAVCLTPYCNTPDRVQHEGNTEPNPDKPHTYPADSKCKPVKYVRWVKVRKDQMPNGKWKYQKRLLPVTVACTCSTDVKQKLTKQN